MGQYYIAYNLDKKEHVESYSYNNGAKLMEHSYLGNDFVGAVEFLLVEGGRWAGDRIVWSGDYSDAQGLSKGDDDVNDNFYMMAEGSGLQMLIEIIPKEYKYILNLDKKEYLNKDECSIASDGFTIHPLPLLLAEGNGRGGGDYPYLVDTIGSWARNRIMISNEEPDNKIYTRITPNYKS